MITLCPDVYVPGAGLNVGVAAVAVVLIVYTAAATALLEKPVATATAERVLLEPMKTGPE